MKLLVILLACLAGCQSPPKSNGLRTDLETTITQLVARAAEGGDENHRDVFVSELNPASFPIAQSSVWRHPKLRRLRTIDGRILADFGVVRTGKTYEFTMWAEARTTGWLISGWEPKMRPVSSAVPMPKGTMAIPPNFAAPALRQSPAERLVFRQPKTQRTKKRDSPAGSKRPTVLTAVSSFSHSVACRPGAIGRLLRRSPGFQKCHATHARAAAHTGRILLDVVESTRILKGTLMESTVGHDPLAQCTVQVLNGLRYKPRPGCRFKVRILFRPKKKR